MRGIFNDTYMVLCLIFFIKAYVVDIHLNCLAVKAIKMSTKNIYFYEEVDKVHRL